MTRNKYRMLPDGTEQFDAMTRRELERADQRSPDPQIARAQESRERRQQEERVKDVQREQRRENVKKAIKAAQSAEPGAKGQDQTPGQEGPKGSTLEEAHAAGMAATSAYAAAHQPRGPSQAQARIKRRRV